MTEQTEKMYYPVKLSQDETDYESYMVRRNPVAQACANCRWFAAPMDCYLVECEPLPILPTGWCNRWEAMPQEKEETVMEELAEVLEDAAEVGMMSRYGVDVAPVVADFVQKRRLLPDKVEPAFKILSNGKWIAYFTNNFLDTDQEILRAKAHEDYVARANAGLVDMPELWRGHIKGTRHGQAERLYLLKTGNAVTVFAIGSFDDTPAGKAAQQFYRKAKPGSVSLSHGFLFPSWAKQDGEYKVYNTFEITTLRRGQEANQFTSFSAKGKDMPLTNGQIEDLKAVYGDAAPEILDNVAKYDKGVQAIVDAGVKHKSNGFANFTDVSGGEQSEGEKSGDAQTLSVLKGLLPTLFQDTAAALEAIDMTNKKVDVAAADYAVAKKAIEAVASFEARLKALETTLEMPATPASEAPSTVVNVPANPNGFTQKDLEDMLGEMKAKQEIDAKKTGGSNATVEAMLFGGR